MAGCLECWTHESPRSHLPRPSQTLDGVTLSSRWDPGFPHWGQSSVTQGGKNSMVSTNRALWRLPLISKWFVLDSFAWLCLLTGRLFLPSSPQNIPQRRAKCAVCPCLWLLLALFALNFPSQKVDVPFQSNQMSSRFWEPLWKPLFGQISFWFLVPFAHVVKIM